MTADAVCYVTTEGYLFQSAVSAAQARLHTASDIEILLIILRPGRRSAEVEAIKTFLNDSGVTVLEMPRSDLGGLHPVFARLMLDAVLPTGVKEILYLDGDTQIVGDLEPLVRAELAPSETLAVRDPMGFIRQIHPRLRREIDGGWDESQIPIVQRSRYVNSGVLRLSVKTLQNLRQASLSDGGRYVSKLRFLDQDALNLLWADSTVPISVKWKFPGFLLATPLHELTSPRIIHFMSDPRPWDGAIRPWGSQHFEPHARAVRQSPGLEPYCQRFNSRAMMRYRAQQMFKNRMEGWAHRSGKAISFIKTHEASVRALD